MNEMNIRTSLSSVDPRDERIYELEDRIEELQLELDQKNIIIKQKDAVSSSLKPNPHSYTKFLGDQKAASIGKWTFKHILLHNHYRSKPTSSQLSAKTI